MEDPDPQLRQSLKEMLFDGDAFRWTRLENLVSSAASQAQLDLEALLDQLLDFLFSPKAGLLRDQLVTATVDRLDALGWSTMQRLGRRLPKRLQPSAIAQHAPWALRSPHATGTCAGTDPGVAIVAGIHTRASAPQNAPGSQ